MKTLLHVFPTFAIGGQQIRLIQIANRTQNEYRHIILALNGDYSAKSKFLPDTDVHYLETEDFKSLPIFTRLPKICSILKSQQFDVLMTYNWGSIEWTLCGRLLSKVPVIHWEDGFGPDEKEKRKLHRNFFRRLVLSTSSTTKLVVPSLGLLDIAKQEWGLRGSRLVYFPNGIALPDPEMAKQTASPKIEHSHPTTIATLATLRAEKNIPRLIDAFANMVSRGRLKIGGDGPVLASLQKYVSSLGLENQVTFTGRVEDVWAFFDDVDIFAISSDTEQMPISVLEAMAVGLPIVSTDVGDVRNMLSTTNASYVVSPDKFAKALNDLASTPEKWHTLGADNKHKVKHAYSFELVLQNFRKLTGSRL
ncbi:glycosyltransferase family 4 protein [Parasalinivibrio latis]|uniref:glycosyltransferase family 4 protein n=1 Tax=Parasalinivibrio latis TaxID=2952610 RepID=UPI0030DF0AF1